MVATIGVTEDSQGSTSPGRHIASQMPAVNDARSNTATPRVRSQSIKTNVAPEVDFLAAMGHGGHDDSMSTVARIVLAAILLFAGVGHFVNTADFLAQVPPWMPWPTAVVYVSGVVEISLGLALLFLTRRRALVGWVVAAFFVVIFPGNIWQFLEGRTAFGLDTDIARFVRLLFQPLLVVWALWCTGAWAAWRQHRATRHTANA